LIFVLNAPINEMSSDDNSVRIHDYCCPLTSDHVTAGSIQNIAKNISETSSTARDLIHTLLRTAAIEELARAIFETTIAIRDTAKEFNDIARDLKEKGIIKNTANVVLDTKNTTRNTTEIAKSEIKKSKKKLANTKRKMGSV
jgi:hypothetical protein